MDRGSLCVWISPTEFGGLALNGQDLGGVSGTSEYEYSITVAPDDLAIVRRALGGPPDADVIELMCANAEIIHGAGELSWLESLGIEVDFDARYDLLDDAS